VSEGYTSTDGGLIWQHVSSSECHLEASSIKHTEGIPLGYFIYFLIIFDTMGGPEHKQDTIAAHKSTDCAKFEMCMISMIPNAVVK
jgi:hypothetical protein